MKQLQSKIAEIKEKISRQLSNNHEVRDLLQDIENLEEYITANEARIIADQRPYQQFMSNSPDILYRFSVKEGGLFWSARVTDILNYTPQQLTQDPYLWFNCIHPDDKKIVDDAIVAYMHGKNINIEYRIFSNSGSIIWLNDRFINLYHDGDDTIIEGHASEITIQKETELKNIAQKEALAREHFRFESVMNSIPAAIYVADFETNELLFMNNYLIDIFGNQVGKKCYEVLQNNQKKVCAFCTNKIIQSHEHQISIPYIWEFQNTKNHRWYQVQDTKILWNDGRQVRLEVATDITDRKNIEDMLKNNEEHLNALINYREEAVWTIDTDFNYVYFNDFFRTEYTKIYGHEAQIGKSAEINIPDWFYFWQPKYQAVMNGERLVFDFKAYYDGENHYYQTFLNPIVVDGQIKNISGFAAEITNRVKNELAIKASEEKLKLIFDLMEVGVSITDQFDNIVECNKASERILGITREDHFKINFNNLTWEILNPDLSIMKCDDFPGIKAQKLNRTIRNVVLGFMNSKETVTWVSVNASPLNTEGLGVMVTYIDISKNILANKALKESEEKYHGLFDSVADAIFVLDLQANFIDVNKTAIDIYGYSYDEFLKLNIAQVDTVDEADYITERMERLIKGEALAFETRHRLKNGQELYVEVNSKIINSDEYPLILAMIRDISERKNNELQLNIYAQELMQLNADKDRFLQILAHDLRSPFNALIGLSDILLKNLKKYDHSMLEGYLLMINQTHHKTFELLEDLLLWTFSQTGKLPFKPENISLGSLCNEIADEKLGQAKVKNIQINISVPSDLEILADRNMLKTVIRNLLSNAIKFTHADGTIKIYAINLNDEVIIHVKDNGIGISPENIQLLWAIDHVFTTKGTNNEQGTGLGLILCKEMITKHKGKIWVESQVSVGSTFYISIPKTYKLSQHAVSAS